MNANKLYECAKIKKGDSGTISRKRSESVNSLTYFKTAFAAINLSTAFPVKTANGFGFHTLMVADIGFLDFFRIGFTLSFCSINSTKKHFNEAEKNRTLCECGVPNSFGQVSQELLHTYP